MNEQTLVELFERTATGHADRAAVADDDRSLSYSELSQRSDVLAGVLARHGVERGDRVAVYRERGVDVFVSMLAVLKAGAAYVVVDPRYPAARRDLMITHSGAGLAVTEPGWSSRLAALDLDVLEWRSRAAAAGRAAARPGPADAACVLFTSGSSGTPKAIVLEHRNLVYFARNAKLPALTPTDRVGQVSSVSFDAFHFETWCAFAHGAGVVVLPAVAELMANDLQRELRRRRITAMLAPTMAVNHVLHEDRDAFAALRVLHTGGDVLQPAAARELLAGSFAGEFHNLYGPTEGTTACTAHRIVDVPPDAGSIPIGRELDGARVHVLDDSLAEVPPGSAGELYIGGRGVARGYLGAPGLTAERFRPDPFAAEPGSRMYATGDLARRGEDGVLEFLGRADDQVKIRGYRVEPREVERVILRHSGVLEAAVIVTGNDQDRRLVALVVLRAGLSPKRLREAVAESAPDYLVPAMFVRVPEIPGNDHGKRDLDQLRRLAVEQVNRQARRVEPRDEVERYLADLWEQLLSVEWIGADDDFFALGGNSMLAFRAQRRIRRDLRVPLDVREILDTSELAGLAALIRARQASVGA